MNLTIKKIIISFYISAIYNFTLAKVYLFLS
jgi:hypothetical protein